MIDRLNALAFKLERDGDQSGALLCFDAVDVIEHLRNEVAGLKNDILDAVDAVRLHEANAHEAHATADELEWRRQADRLERIAA